MYVLVSLDTAKVLASVDRKIDGLSQWARNGKVLQIVEVKGLIQKRKMKVKKKRPVSKAVRIRKLRQHLVPKGQRMGQLHRPPRPDAVAAPGSE